MGSELEEATMRRLDEVNREVEAVIARLRDLLRERHELTVLLGRLAGTAQPNETSDIPRESTSGGRVTPLVRSVLQATPHPATRNEIAAALSTPGHPVAPDVVSASLSYLQRRGVVVNLGGKWMSVSPPGAS